MQDLDPEEKWENKTSGWGIFSFSFLSRCKVKESQSCAFWGNTGTCNLSGCHSGGGRVNAPGTALHHWDGYLEIWHEQRLIRNNIC